MKVAEFQDQFTRRTLSLDGNEAEIIVRDVDGGEHQVHSLRLDVINSRDETRVRTVILLGD